MKKIRIAATYDGDILKVNEEGKTAYYNIIKINNNYNALCKDKTGRKTWINTAVNKTIIAAYTH